MPAHPLVGTAADPTKGTVFQVPVGRSTVTADKKFISGRGFVRDRTPVEG